MASSSIGCVWPCCNRPADVQQTKSSVATRVVTVSLGVIALSAGFMALCGVPGLNALSTTACVALAASGGLLFLASVRLRCTQEAAQLQELPPQQLIQVDFNPQLFKLNLGYQMTSVRSHSWITEDQVQNRELYDSIQHKNQINYETMPEQKRLLLEASLPSSSALDESDSAIC